MSVVTYLTLVVERGFVDVLRVALDAGVSVDSCTPDHHKSPLICVAAMYGQTETARELIARGADVNATFLFIKPKAGIPILVFALKDKNGETYHIDRPMCVTACDLSALDIALGFYCNREPNPSLVKLLRQAGAKTAIELGGRDWYDKQQRN